MGWYLLYSYLIFIGIIIIFGLIIALCNFLFYKMVGRSSKFFCYATGIIGTPIHESGHALFCLIFGHKIEEIKFFQVGENSLGYVNHSYNKKNFYHQLGNFYISIGPIILGCTIEILLFLICANSSFINYVNSSINSVNNNIIDFGALLGNVFTCVFSIENFTNPFWYIFIIISFFISMHMDLSLADIKGGLLSFFINSAIVIIINLILYLIFNNAMYNVCNIYGSILLSIILISLVFCGIQLLLATIIFIFRLIFKKR